MPTSKGHMTLGTFFLGRLCYSFMTPSKNTVRFLWTNFTAWIIVLLVRLWAMTAFCVYFSLYGTFKNADNY